MGLLPVRPLQLHLPVCVVDTFRTQIRLAYGMKRHHPIIKFVSFFSFPALYDGFDNESICLRGFMGVQSISCRVVAACSMDARSKKSLIQMFMSKQLGFLTFQFRRMRRFTDRNANPKRYCSSLDNSTPSTWHPRRHIAGESWKLILNNEHKYSFTLIHICLASGQCHS